MEQKARCILCKNMVLDTMPFKTWLGCKYRVYSIHKLSRYRLNSLWIEYRADMCSLGLRWESAKNFGLWG